MGMIEHLDADGAGAREYLTFRLDKEEYGIDILKVQEIRGYEPPTRIANAPHFIKGVVNLRGVIVPIVDMNGRFRDPAAANQALESFVNTAFFSDLPITKTVEIHMNLIDGFSKQLKLEGHKNDFLQDYRLALLDVLVSPQHDLSLARVLKSPLLGVSDAALVQQLEQRGHPQCTIEVFVQQHLGQGPGAGAGGGVGGVRQSVHRQMLARAVPSWPDAEDAEGFV